MAGFVLLVESCAADASVTKDRREPTTILKDKMDEHKIVSPRVQFGCAAPRMHAPPITTASDRECSRRPA